MDSVIMMILGNTESMHFQCSQTVMQLKQGVCSVTTPSTQLDKPNDATI